MALDACIVPTHIVQRTRIHDVLLRRMRHMQASRSVAFLAAHVPLGHCLCRNVVVHRVATIARWPSRTIKVAWPIKGQPPIRPVLSVIRQPALLRDVPLCRERKVVIAAPGKVSLLPAAAVDESHFVQPKRPCRIGLCEVSQYRVRMHLRIANDIRHPRRFPPRELLCMAALATCRPNELGLRLLCEGFGYCAK